MLVLIMLSILVLVLNTMPSALLRKELLLLASIIVGLVEAKVFLATFKVTKII